MADKFGHQPQNTEEASDGEVRRRTHMQAQGSFKGPAFCHTIPILCDKLNLHLLGVAT